MPKRRMTNPWILHGALAALVLHLAGCGLLTVEEDPDQVATSLEAIAARNHQRALDQNGDSFVDSTLTITWTVLTGGGSVAPTTSQTDLSGIAATAWTLGIQAGEQTLQASSPGVSPATLTATAVSTAVVDSLTVGTATASGGTASVDVGLLIAEAQGGVQFTLAFSDSLTATVVTATARLDTMMVAHNAGTDSGALTVVVYPELAEPVPTIGAGSGTIVTVTFEIVAGTPAGTYGLLVTQARISDTAGNSSAIQVRHGAVIVP